ncbi:Ethanolamine-phosphate cytidylyltransferase [Lamellibrachia satsuma]|nr:Ethanolamine-phosphate cytidylyltransferase [Lamellibrachia satsuma]
MVLCDLSAKGRNGFVWILMASFDLFHFGHANALRQAKQLGDYLVAGVHSDATISENKAPPVYTEEERYQLISAIKWVDETVEDAPFKLTPEFLKKHNCDFCVHGDDISLNTEGNFSYQVISDAGFYRVIPRTKGVSTTALVGRMLLATRSHHEIEEDKVLDKACMQNIAQGRVARSPATGISQFFPSTKRIAEFSSGQQPKQGDRVIYVTGAFDLFHVGHLKFLEKAMDEGDYLLVGIHTDPVANKYKGENYPIMNMHERVLTVLSIKYVDEVLIGAPYILTEDLMNYYNIHLVVHGSTPVTPNPDGSDPFAVPKRMGKFKVIESGCELRSEKIIDRIIKNRLLYEERNRKKEAKEIKYIEKHAIPH